MAAPGMRARHVAARLDAALASARVVVLGGPRQAGKSTLGRAHVARNGTYTSLDQDRFLAPALADPEGFVTGFAEPLVIDEVQRGGDALVRAVKVAVDEDPRAGRFLLTGSTRFLTVPTLSESLAGRARLIDLWPFSQGELRATPERFLDRLLSGPAALRDGAAEALERRDLFALVCRGGFPEVQRIEHSRDRDEWFDSYARTVTQRDVRDLTAARRLDELPRLLRLLAARTAQELVVAHLAADLALPRQTLHDYLPLLETVYLVQRLPAWSRNLTAKVSRHPKLHVTDTGLAASLLGVGADALSAPTATAAGPLLETFVVNELIKQRTWAETRAELHHFRDRGGQEVDVVVEARDGRVAGVEVKAARSVRQQDFRGLALLRDRLGDSFVQGVVLHIGDHPLSFGDRLTALPVSALWAP